MSKSKSKRVKRSPEQMIADLEAKIQAVKKRAERQKAKRDPALRHIQGAVRAIDKALAATNDGATRKALDEARATLTACLAMSGGPSVSARGTLIPQPRGGPRVDAGRVLEYLEKHPGSRAEDMSTALDTDSKGLRPTLQQLRAEGKARTEGKARATRYFVAEED